MSQDIDPIMQAAERLVKENRHFLDEVPDLRAVAEWAIINILPKGKRPVAICSYDATEGQTLWNIDDETALPYSGVVISAGPNHDSLLGIEWEDSIGFGDEGYATEAEAKLALQWERLSDLCALAS